MRDQLEKLAREIGEAETAERVRHHGPDSHVSTPEYAPVTIKERSLFYAIDIGTSGAFMVRKADGAVFGIKGYGTPDYRKGICFLGEMNGAQVLAYRHARGPFCVTMRDVRTVQS